MELSPSATSIWLQKSRLELKLGRLYDAIDSCTRVVASGTEAPGYLRESYLGRGQTYQRLGKRELALADFQKSLEVDPTNGNVYNQLAWFLVTGRERTTSDIEQGVKYARRAVELAPNDATYRNTLGVALYFSEQWQEAIDALQKSIIAAKTQKTR